MGIEKLSTIKTIPATGIALFIGVVRSETGHTTEDICEVIVPPLPVLKNWYRCDSRFHTEAISDLFQDHNSYGLLVICNDIASLYIITGTMKIYLGKVTGELMTKSRRGGQSANRIARLRVEKRVEYQKKIIDACVKFTHRKVMGIVVGGQSELPNEVIERYQQDTRCLVPILGKVKVSTGILENAVNETYHNSLEIIHGDMVKQERDIQNMIMDILEREPDKLVFGLDYIKQSDTEYLLEKIIHDNKNEPTWSTSGESIEIKYCDFLDQYQGIIGIRYY
jgi:peptide chain release factor subunit 1